MGVGSAVRRKLNREINSTNLRLVRYPAAIAGVNIISNGAAALGAYCVNWIQVVIAGTIANPCWIAGVVLGTPQVEAFYGDITIGIGAAGFEVTLATVPVGTDLFPVVDWVHPVIWLPEFIQVLASPRLAANIRKSTGASVAGFNNCAVLAYTGL